MTEIHIYDDCEIVSLYLGTPSEVRLRLLT